MTASLPRQFSGLSTRRNGKGVMHMQPTCDNPGIGQTSKAAGWGGCDCG